ncbi:CGNR zinc finger domain-containing protein [bacterium]|nr:CGNR zinc finger domain-containing protein [bacterium]MCI0601579.1 CGNR zinc finger domain-containing protein [bacterium]
MSKQRFDAGFTPQSSWLDLVNSQQWDGFGRLTDHLLEPRWVARFLRYWKLPEKLILTNPIVELAQLRNFLRRSIEKIASGESLSRQDLWTFNAFLNAPGYLKLVAKGKRIRTELRPLRLDWTWIKSQVAASFVDSFQQQRNRIKICENTGCRWAFFDKTKGNIRRWCKDTRCGNRDRVRRARARHRSLS